MNRNVVMTASSAFVLILLFVAYTRIVRDPPAEPIEKQSLSGMSAPDAESRKNAIKFGPDGQIEIPGGGAVDYTVYDDRTGMPIQRIRWTRMRPVAGAQKEFHINEPRFSQRLPGGGTATVSADQGVIIAERVNKTKGAWKQGSLSGNVRIVVDRRPFDEEPAAAGEDSDDVVTITMDDLHFDLELGKLKTDGPLKLIGADFEVEGIGLDLTWNQAANRVDELHIRQGKRMALYRESGLFGFGGPAVEKDRSGEQPSDSGKPEKPRRPAPRERLTSYLCTLEGAVEARRYDKQNQLVAGLSAGGLELLFDIGRSGGMFGGDSDEQATTQPASRPARGERARMELTWSGGLSLVPADPPAKPMRWGRKRGQKLPPVQARRRLVALGPDVVLTQGDSSILCGRLEFFDDTQQIWLHREGHANVRMKLDADSWATASAIYIDRTRDIIKLVGDVYLESARKPEAFSSGQPAIGGRSAGVMTIACSQIAELHLYPSSGGGAAALGDELKSVSNELQSATFFGDVRVRMNDRFLSAHRLDIAFRKLSAGESFDALIEQAVATGEVVFTGQSDHVESGRLVLDFGIAPGGKPYVSRIDAHGRVEMKRGDSWLRGERVVALLDSPVQTGEPQRSGEFAVRTLDVDGNAELRRPEDNLGARGDHIAVWFAGENEFERAEITGTRERPAIVHASPYTVRGGRIDISGPALSLDVDGWSRLTFVTQRGFQGARGRPAKVVVTSDKALHVDGLNDTVRIEGTVVATRGDEQLLADSVTLFLESVETPSDARPAAFGFAQLWQAARASLLGGGARLIDDAQDNTSTGVFGVTKMQLGRKEPVRLRAENALVRMEIPDPTSDRPLVHRSLSAPLIEVDIVNQTTYTTGLTDLLVQDYRVTQPAGPASSLQLIPSDLISGGPMQTVIRCEDGLTYALGGGEPGARDSVVLEGGVQMLHLSGREILDFDKMPRMAQLDQQTLQQLKNRHTTLDCERLECQFGRGGDGPGPMGDADQLGSRLMWLLGTGDVHLRDRQGDTTTEINAARISFDRPSALISIFGTEDIDARVYRWNTAKNEFSNPYIGPEFHLDLRNNTIRGSGRGEVRP